MGHPFLYDFPELVTIDSCYCANEAVVNTIRTLGDTGTKKYQEYVETVLEVRSNSIHDTNHYPCSQRSSKSDHGLQV